MLSAAKIFQSGMVLQCDKPQAIWGSADAGEEITVMIQNKKETAAADSEGNWRVSLPKLQVSHSETLSISGKEKTIVLEDIAVGEVWIAGGQSNMEYPMGFEKHIAQVRPGCDNPMIRFYDVPEAAFEGQLEAFDYSRVGIWRKATPKDIDYFTAVGYYFAAKLQKELGVPVGIIGCNWGGTQASAWMKEESVKEAGKEWMHEHEQAVKNLDMKKFWEEQKSNVLNQRGNLLEDPFSRFVLPRTPSEEEVKEFMFRHFGGNEPDFATMVQPQAFPGALYEHMLKTITPIGARGIIWYQGESDDSHAEIYDKMLACVVRDWREALEDMGLSFLLVQLPGFEHWMECYALNYPKIRECQEKVADTVPNVWMASITDGGEQFDIHPKNKRLPGERLALLALGKVYGKDLLCEAPVPDQVTWEENTVKIHFAHAAGGLHIKGEELNALEIQPKMDYTYEIQGENLLIFFKDKLPKTLQFAKTAFYAVNLYNQSDIPAVPFEAEL